MIDKEANSSVDNICRSCMISDENMQNVFENKEYFKDNKLQLAQMLTDCTSVKVLSGDGLPHLLCTTCEGKLISAYDFKILSEKTDIILREIFKPVNLNDCGVKQEDIIVQPDLNNEVSDDLFDVDPGRDTDSEDQELHALPKQSVKKKTNKFTCTFCDKSLRTKKGLKIHQRRHTGENLRTCNVCNAQFTRSHHLIRHMQTHATADNNTENCECDVCGKLFGNLTELKSHIKTHSAPEETAQSIFDNSFEEENKETANNSDGDNMKTNNSDEEDSVHSSSAVDQVESVNNSKEKSNFPCEYCSKELTTMAGLKIHMRKHTGTDLATCNICKKSFTKSSHLKRHQQTHGIVVEPKSDKEKKIMECEFCDRKFKYKKSFNHHMQTEHGISDDSDVSLNNIVEKAKIKEEKSVVPETVSDEDDVNEDASPSFGEEVVKPTRSKVHSCHVCQAVFARANHLTRHMTLHRALLIYKCNQCENAYATQEILDKHVEDDHINKPYVCTMCNKQFSRGEHLIRHLKVHQSATGEDALKCSICEKTFTRSDHLARHTKIHLLQDKRHVCAECGKAFNRLDNLKTHQRIHTGIKDTSKLHLCIYCGKEFNNSSNMIVHMRRHTGERPYKCTQCGKGFPRSHDLKCHERTHSGEKPYLCTLCGKSFNKSNKLLRHTRVHTGERPYVCSICGRAFTQSNDLALHMRRHTGARPYACGMCPARFIQSGQLKAHRRSTGHWMETQPDLKGGHRVEPVTPILDPVPIRFRIKPSMKEDEKPPELMLNPDEVMAHMGTNDKLIELSGSELELQTSLANEIEASKMSLPAGLKLKIEHTEKDNQPLPESYQHDAYTALQKSYNFQNFM